MFARRIREPQWFYSVERLKVATKAPVKKAVAKKAPVKKAAAKKAVAKKVVASQEVATIIAIPEVPVERKKSTVVRTVRPKLATQMETIVPEISGRSSIIKQFAGSRFISLMVLVAVLSSLITFGITHVADKGSSSTTTYLAKISGGVALTEPELRDVVRQLKRTVFWTGPMNKAKYTINALTDGQTYIRYLPNGDGVSDTSPKYRTVGTYTSKDAYTATLAAGNEANGVSFTTSDGRVIHYNKASEGNVYVAYKNLDYQIEVFDPSSGTALKIANANGLSTIK